MDEQKNTTEVNTDEILEYPDFSKLNRVNFRKLPKDTILGILKSHFLIYAV